ncbi:hypothetical protein BH10ACT3_BH10ACT3_01780 [soil metagenome]
MLLCTAVHQLAPDLGATESPAAPWAQVAGASLVRGQDETDTAAPVPDGELPSGVFIVHAQGCGEMRQATATLVQQPGGPLLVTNAHLVRGAGSVEVEDPDGDSWTATVVGLVSGRDVAILRPDGGESESEPLLDRAMSTGASAQTADPVWVYGYPDGEAAALPGHVLGLEPRSGYGGTTDMLIVDAPAHGGVSGGAVLDSNGSVVGLVAARDPDSGLVVAYPIDAALTGSLVRSSSC